MLLSKSKRLFFLPVTAFLLMGCVEVMLSGVLLPNGAAELEFSYVMNMSIYDSKYVVVEKNQLLPLTDEGIDHFVKRFPGALLVKKRIDETLGPATPFNRNQPVPFRHVRFMLNVQDINAMRTNHFHFLYYTLGNNNYFVFRIQKNVRAQPVDEQDRPGENDFAEVLAKDQALTLTMTLPLEASRHNATSAAGRTLTWRIPIVAILSDPQREIIAWAEFADSSNNWLASGVNRVKLATGSASVIDPNKLPTILLDDPAYNQTQIK